MAMFKNYIMQNAYQAVDCTTVYFGERPSFFEPRPYANRININVKNVKHVYDRSFPYKTTWPLP